MYNKAMHSRWLRVVGIVAAALLMAFGINRIIVPQALYNGGVLGLCQVIRTLLDTRLGIRVADVDLAGALNLLANIPLIILAWRTLGRTFVAKLILGTVCSSLFMVLIPVPAQPVVEDVLTSCLIGGLINGASIGLMLTCGGSSGGLDILGLYLSKKRGITVGRMSIMFNAALFTTCLVLFDARTAIYSAIFSVISSLMVDRMHQQNITVQALIITKERGESMPRAIMEAIGRGVTCWEGLGAYTGDDVQVLCVCLSKYEIEILQEAVHAIDPAAFIMVQEGVRTSGNFKRHLS